MDRIHNVFAKTVTSNRKNYRSYSHLVELPTLFLIYHKEKKRRLCPSANMFKHIDPFYSCLIYLYGYFTLPGLAGLWDNYNDKMVVKIPDSSAIQAFLPAATKRTTICVSHRNMGLLQSLIHASKLTETE